MDKSLRILCNAVSKILGQLKAQSTPLSFVLLTGKDGQGKTELLRQSNLKHYSIDEEERAQLFYNHQGIILELGEDWLNQSQNLLSYSLKQLNRCHSSVRISGIIWCVDSNALLQVEAPHLMEHCKSQVLLLERFGRALGYAMDTILVLTRLDALAGFCEFFHSEHTHDLGIPLGFSIDSYRQRSRLMAQYKQRFDQMVEVLGQKIINKLHPARSSLKRTLIREFPLQLASLRIPVQALLQQISAPFFNIQGIYFTSARQGGISIDKLNQKIQREYALTVQDKFPQSNNFRPYFIEGALTAFQENTQFHKAIVPRQHKIMATAAVLVLAVIFAGLGFKYFRTSSLLDNASRELLAFEASGNHQDPITALYHLSKAQNQMEQIPRSLFPHPMLNQLKQQLNNSTRQRLHDKFVPEMLSMLETVISSPTQSQPARYQALKTYLMLADPKHYSEKEVLAWFNEYWQNSHSTKLTGQQEFLLRKTLNQPLIKPSINQQLVRDARNYLNALPAAYLYYSLAREKFPQEKITLQSQGFVLFEKDIPVYFTKEGFRKVMAALPDISTQLQQENWVLARQDLTSLESQIADAYSFAYAGFWQNFIKKTRPAHYQNYQQARELTQMLHQSNSINALIRFIQQQTSPELDGTASLFNQKVAIQFTSLNLMSVSSSQELTQTLNELEQFLTTLSLVSDQGKTVFELTQARFRGDASADPLSALYSKSRQLPEPIASWSRQVADDTWFIFINESRQYLNRQWQRLVFNNYRVSIANRYPLDPLKLDEVSLVDFDHFFAPRGILNSFVNQFLKPFLDTSQPQWKPKEINGYMMPISAELVNELIRSNVISNMFFPEDTDTSKIEFSLQKINLDPVVTSMQLSIGNVTLNDNQSSDSETSFTWPQRDARLTLNSIEGKHFELVETGQWAFFRMLQKVNVLVDSNDSASLQILFEVNGNSGRYLLKTQNQINPFSPGILTGFKLDKTIA